MVDSKIIKKDRRKIILGKEDKMIMFSMKDWEKTTIEEVKMR